MRHEYDKLIIQVEGLTKEIRRFSKYGLGKTWSSGYSQKGFFPTINQKEISMIFENLRKCFLILLLPGGGG